MYAAPLELDQQPAPDTPHRHDTLCLLGLNVHIHAKPRTAQIHLRQRHKQTARHGGHVCHRHRVKSSSANPLRHGRPHLQQHGDQTHARALPDAARQSCREICLHITLGGVLTFAVALVAGDVIQFALSFIFHPGIHHSCLWDMICCFITGSGNQQVADMLLFRGNIAAMTIAYSGLLWLHSYCTLCGTLLRRHPTACVALSLILLIFAINPADQLGILPTARNTQPTVGVTTAVAAVLIGLSIANYVGSYRIFKRMQIICDKFTNL